MSRAPRQAVWRLWQIYKGHFMADPMLKILKTTRLIAASALGLLLSGCLGPGNDIDEIVQRQCPSIGIVATADKLVVEDASFEITEARLKCFINRDNEDELLVAVRLSGRAGAGKQVPLFLASLGENDAILARTQYKVMLAQGDFTITLPNFSYGKKGSKRRPRMVAGFVLTQAQLAANRTAYRKTLGLSD